MQRDNKKGEQMIQLTIKIEIKRKAVYKHETTNTHYISLICSTMYICMTEGYVSMILFFLCVYLKKEMFFMYIQMNILE